MNAAIVFDLDGTLYQEKGLDDENFEAAVASIAEQKNVRLKIAEDMLVSARDCGDAKTSISLAIKNIGVKDEVFRKHQLNLLNPKLHIKSDMELVSLVRGLSKYYKLILLTNTRREITIEAISILGFSRKDFDLIISGGDGFPPKPSKETLLHAIVSVGDDPKISYSVGDRWEVDHQPGVSLGVTAITIKNRDNLIVWLKSMLQGKR